MVGQKIRRENLARYYGGIINSGEWYLADKADAVMDALELQHKADAELIAADRRNMDAMKERIKELEYQLSDKGRKNSELFATNAELRNRIKELEDELGRVTDAQISSKDELGQPEHIVDANKMVWISVKDRMPDECEPVFVYNDTDKNCDLMWAEKYEKHWEWCNGDVYLSQDTFTHWMPLPNPPEDKETK